MAPLAITSTSPAFTAAEEAEVLNIVFGAFCTIPPVTPFPLASSFPIYSLLQSKLLLSDQMFEGMLAPQLLEVRPTLRILSPSPMDTAKITLRYLAGRLWRHHGAMRLSVLEYNRIILKFNGQYRVQRNNTYRYPFPDTALKKDESQAGLLEQEEGKSPIAETCDLGNKIIEHSEPIANPARTDGDSVGA